MLRHWKKHWPPNWRAHASQELTTYGFVAPFGRRRCTLVHVSGDFR
jgi:DNA recombination-dependent growth factor C